MFKFYILAVIAVVPFITCFPGRQTRMHFELRDPFKIYKGQKPFAVSLLNALQKWAPEKNHFFSPHSTYHALLLAYFGAEGEAMESLEQVLALDWASNGKSDVSDAYKVLKSLKADWRSLEQSVEFKTVDKLYVKKDAELQENVTALLGESIEKIDFTQCEERRAEINAFVRKVTDGHIKELLPSGSIMPSTNLVLLNAASFKGLWKTRFNENETQKKKFNSVTPSEVEMMHVQGEFTYAVSSALDAAFLEIPFKTKNIEKPMTMQVFLPFDNTPNAINDVLDNFSLQHMYDLVSTRSTRLVDIQFPKISMDLTYKSLAGALETMGVAKLFGKDANMSGFSNSTNLYFDDIVHKAQIEIDESGSTAAAATGGISNGIGPILPVEVVKFHCDHPFIFMINDAYSNEILFEGIYRSPIN